MIENTKNGTTLELNRVDKKKWEEPQMTQLNIKETKGGETQSFVEFEWQFISLRS